MRTIIYQGFMVIFNELPIFVGCTGRVAAQSFISSFYRVYFAGSFHIFTASLLFCFFFCLPFNATSIVIYQTFVWALIFEVALLLRFLFFMLFVSVFPF